MPGRSQAAALVDDNIAWNARGWRALPSWMLSLVLHIIVLGLFALTMQGPRIIGVRAGDDRIVGIYHKESHDTVPQEVPGTPEGNINDSQPTEGDRSTAQSAPAAQTASKEGQTEDQGIASLLDLPSAPPDRIGVGPAFPVPTQNEAPRTVRAASGPQGKKGTPGASFFKATATGKRIVYVIDSSGSMTNHDAIGVAKAELLASLQGLTPEQEFQIIFYNVRSAVMERPGQKRGLLFGTDLNRTFAQQFIRSIQPDGGTDHLSALLLAFSLKPDAIFFLTDAEEPALSGADLEKIRKLNGDKCQIHTVEFGIGANLAVDNFLKKLARQNNGTFTYRDVNHFDKP